MSILAQMKKKGKAQAEKMGHKIKNYRLMGALKETAYTHCVDCFANLTVSLINGITGPALKFKCTGRHDDFLGIKK